MNLESMEVAELELSDCLMACRWGPFFKHFIVKAIIKKIIIRSGKDKTVKFNFLGSYFDRFTLLKIFL